MNSQRFLVAGVCLLVATAAGLAQGQPRQKEVGQDSKRPQKKKNLGPLGSEATPDALFRVLDTNNDGKLSKEELQNAVKLLERLDKNTDGSLDLAEVQRFAQKVKEKGGRPGEIITPAAKGERQKETLKVGDPAPDFTLPELKGNGKVTLSSFRGKKPVVLIFASYT